MSRTSASLLATLLALIATGCSDSTSPPGESCSSTGIVTVTTTTTSNGLVMDWSPRCAVAMVLVEEDASDMWYAAAPDVDDTSTEAANIILPPVTYGQVPPGAEGSPETLPLVAGHTYEIVLWRIVASDASATCHARFGNACMIGQKTFVH